MSSITEELFDKVKRGINLATPPEQNAILQLVVMGREIAAHGKQFGRHLDFNNHSYHIHVTESGLVYRTPQVAVHDYIEEFTIYDHEDCTTIHDRFAHITMRVYGKMTFYCTFSQGSNSFVGRGNRPGPWFNEIKSVYENIALDK